MASQLTVVELGALEQISEEIRLLQTLEVEVAEQLGISGENIDSVEVFFKAKNKAVSNKEYLPTLKNLNELHRLRLHQNVILNNSGHQMGKRPLALGLPYAVDASRFWAVLIGINEYPLNHRLHGCVSDAQSMEKYLTTYLGVPRDRIQLLLGSNEHTSPSDPMHPSRAHIVSMLTGLITEDNIQHGDNIIIYYAGHGTFYYDDEGDLGFIEALCPIDRDALGANGNPVTDISDREINGILTEISHTKSHRITLILDCCHSGGASRELPEPGSRTAPATRYTTLQNMLLTGDDNLKAMKRYRAYLPKSILAKDWCPDMDSHVLMAACKEYQLAKEKMVKREDGTAEYVGIFTNSLLRVLQSGYWRKETTYADLVFGIGQSSHQMPVIAGNHKDACIWYQD